MNWSPEELQSLVDDHPLVLFMKGGPNQPQCGFSNRAAQVLQSLGEEFASVNVLSDPAPSLPSAPGRTSPPCRKSSFTVNSSAGRTLRSRCCKTAAFAKCLMQAAVRDFRVHRTKHAKSKANGSTRRHDG